MLTTDQHFRLIDSHMLRVYGAKPLTSYEAGRCRGYEDSATGQRFIAERFGETWTVYSFHENLRTT